ncbi:hypothetical protein ACLOJK_015934 [Asimina triloba]
MKTPFAATPILPVLLFLAAALSTSSVAAAARSIHSFHRQAHLLPQFHGAFFSPSFERSQAQRNLLPLNARDRLHAMTRFQRQNRFMSPLDRNLVARFGTEFRFNRLPSLETKSPHVQKPDPSLPVSAWNKLPPECLQIRHLKTYLRRKQKVRPHGHSRELLKAPYTNPAPPPPTAHTSVICDMALIGMGWWETAYDDDDESGLGLILFISGGLKSGSLELVEAVVLIDAAVLLVSQLWIIGMV